MTLYIIVRFLVCAAIGLLYTAAVSGYAIGVFIGTQKLGSFTIKDVKQWELLTRWALWWMRFGVQRGATSAANKAQ